MSITQHQKMLVRYTFGKIAPQSAEVAETFYNRLFEIAPQTRSLFKGDMREQGVKLMQMISVAVMSLDKLETLVPGLRAMGERHVEYGVRYEDYALVGEALLWALEQKLASEWTPEVKEAWTQVYHLLSETAVSDTYDGIVSE